MAQKGQITRFIKYLFELIRPKYVYEVINTDALLVRDLFFRTERDALKYMWHQADTDPYIYNGVYSLKLKKHNYHGERTDNKA